MTRGSATKRTVLVTGGGDGIGLATAIRFARAGHRVVVAGRRADRLDAAAAEVGAGTAVLAMDVADSASIEAGVAGLADRGLAVDVLVNNAGLIGNAAGAGRGLARELRRSLETNLIGPALLCDLLVPAMAARGWGRVVNVASTAGLAAPLGQLPYSTSKAAIVALTRGLAVDLAEAGVTVNAVAPGPVATASWLAAKGPAGRASRAVSVPSGRLTEPDEVASAILFLAGEDAGQITGQVLVVDGGEAAAGPYATLWQARRSDPKR